MTVGIDVSPLNDQNSHRGVGVYTRNLIDSLHQYVSAPAVTLMRSADDLDSVDVIHYPFFDFFFLTLPNKYTRPTVITVHDAIPLVMSKHYHPGVKGKMKLLRQRHRLGNADAVITDSHQSKADIVKYLRYPEKKIHVIYLAPSKKVQRMGAKVVKSILLKYQIDSPYFLYVGDINYNKNILGLLEAFHRLPTKKKLVLVSKAMKQAIPESINIRAFIESRNLKNKVKILTNVPGGNSPDMGSLYSGASWYIQPSYYEGFGLPVLEAMKCGTPVISSLGGSLKEVVGDVGVTYDPVNPRGLFLAMKAALKLTRSQVQDLSKKSVRHAKTFSWKETALKTAEVYRMVSA